MDSDDLKDADYSKGRFGMHYGAAPIIFELAEELRGRMTEAEKILWNVLRKNDWQLNFRRQHPLSIYIADFYCHKIKLVIELDGGYHENKEMKIYDEKREHDISEFGIRVIRFNNKEVINDIENVRIKIKNAIASTTENKMEQSESENINPLKPSEEVSGLRNSPEQGPDFLSGGAGGTSRVLPPLFVIKIGGNVIDNDDTLNSFLKDFASINAKKILVHGGGKVATKIGEQLGIQSNYINGRRITDAATIDLVTMVYGGLVNKKIVARLQALQCNAIGLTGADGNTIPAIKRPVINSLTNSPSREDEAETAEGIETYPLASGEGDETAFSSKSFDNKGEEEKAERLRNSPLGDGGKTGSSNTPPLGAGGIDYGFVGDIKSGSLNIDTLEVFLFNNLTPIFAPLTHDGNGQMLNTNADTIASTLAVGLSEKYDVRLIYCFEKKGVLENVADENSVIRLITKEKYGQLKQDNKLFDGILPKIDNAFAAIDNGVNEVLIGDANDLLQNVTANTIGTLIK